MLYFVVRGRMCYHSIHGQDYLHLELGSLFVIYFGIAKDQTFFLVVSYYSGDSYASLTPVRMICD